MKKLIKGLHKFQTEVFPIEKDFFRQLAQKGQNPETLFITCSDSRLNPQAIVSADPGDLFILRNAGNIVPSFTGSESEAATIEFAVNVLKVKEIIICGHSYCGAVEGVFHLEDLKKSPNLHHWINTNISPTLELVKKNYEDLTQEALNDIVLQEHVLRQVENLKTHPSVASAVANHTIGLHAWIYKFEDGDILSFNSQNGQFEQIKHF